MTTTLSATDWRRFANSARLVAHTALASYQLDQGSRTFVSGTASFRALAAKGPQDWRFPEGGMTTMDDLLAVTLERGPALEPAALVLQAMGVAGLEAFAGWHVRLVLADGREGPDGIFDAAGRLVLDLAAFRFKEMDLAEFEVVPVSNHQD